MENDILAVLPVHRGHGTVAAAASAVAACTRAVKRAVTYVTASTSVGWTLGTPLKNITDPGGLDITSTTVFIRHFRVIESAPLRSTTRLLRRGLSRYPPK